MLIGTITLCTTTAANAGWFSDLFSTKEAEPQTLQEACDLEKVKTICPEIILGEKTLVECLTENVKNVSTTCINYVKKSVSENSTEISAFTEQIKSAATEKTTDVKTGVTDVKETIKNNVSEKIDTAKLELAKKLLESSNQ